MKRRYEEESSVQRENYNLILASLTQTYVLVRYLLVVKWLVPFDVLLLVMRLMWPRCSVRRGWEGGPCHRAVSLEQFCALCFFGGPYDAPAWERFADPAFFCVMHAVRTPRLFWCIKCCDRVCQRHQQDNDSHCHGYVTNGQRCPALICHSCFPYTAPHGLFECAECKESSEAFD